MSSHILTKLTQCMLALTSLWTAVICTEPRSWIDEDIVNATTTYSVIVEAANPRPSNQFADKQRVQFFHGVAGEGRVVSVQYTPHLPQEAKRAPFIEIGRDFDNADKRVRLVTLSDISTRDDTFRDKVSHLEDVCADNRETTIMVTVNEICVDTFPPEWLPAACLSNVIRIYPFNNASVGTTPPQAYMPLGPRNTFPFIQRERIHVASERSLFLNLEVSLATSPRRSVVVDLVEAFAKLNPEVPIANQDKHYNYSEWQTLLLDSTFTMCPGGHNAETYRLWEALEAGSIPIVAKEDYTHPGFTPNNFGCGFGDFAWNTVASSPFANEVAVDTWDELPARLLEIRQKSDHYINQLQADCMAWYSARMTHTYSSLLNFGEGNDMFPQLGPIIDIREADA